MKEEQIIAQLSAMHRRRASDPSVLCHATIHDMATPGKDFQEFRRLQNLLFEICRGRGDPWTKAKW